MNDKNTPQLSTDQQALSYKQWVLYIFLAGLPMVGLILLLLWAFGNDGNINRREWAKGMLLIYLIGIALVVLLMVIFGLGTIAFLGAQQS